jgi:hypothetical protein
LDQTELALAELREAVRLGQGSVGPSYDLFQMLLLVPSDEHQDESFQALKSVYQKESQNLFVIKDWLPMLAQYKSPEFSDASKQAQSTISPFVELIKVHTRIDLNQTIDSALKDAAEGNWAKVQRSMTIFKNLLTSEAPRDKRYVMLDSLEYILFDYSEQTRSQLDLTHTGKFTPSKPVHFLSPVDLSAWPTFASSEKAKVSTTDFDLDGRLDLAVFEGNQLAVWGQKTSDAPWKILVDAEITGAFTGLLVDDLDDDIDSDIRGKNTADHIGKPSKTPDVKSEAAERLILM